MTSVSMRRRGDDIPKANCFEQIVRRAKIADLMQFAVVSAVTDEWAIGRDGRLPWHPRFLHEDMGFFKRLTTGSFSFAGDQLSIGDISHDKINVVVMGRKTWDSIPPKFRPLEGRFNIVITTTLRIK